MIVAFTSRFDIDNVGGIESVVRELVPAVKRLRPDWTVLPIHAFDRPSRWNAIPLFGDLVAGIVLAIRVRKANVVVINGAEYAWPRTLASKMLRSTIVSWHGTRADEIPSLAPRLTFPIRVYRALEIKLQGLALAIRQHIVVGPEVAEELRRCYRTDAGAKIIPNGAPDRSAITRRPVPERILWVGTTPYKKGLDLAIEACRIARRRNPNLVLRIVGLRRDDASIPDECWIDVGGRISPAQMSSEYESASAMLASTRYEGCSMAILEAMTYGVPIISSAGIRWMLGTGALCSASLDAPSLAAILEDVIENPEKLVNAARSAYEQLPNFNWSSAAKGYVEAIEDCAGTVT